MAMSDVFMHIEAQVGTVHLLPRDVLRWKLSAYLSPNENDPRDGQAQ
jgi:hypothetical protein